MLNISANYQTSIENGGLFISRGLGHHPTRILESWELIFVEQGILAICEGDREFRVKAGESLLLLPGRKHKGVGDFPANLKFYWLHFNIIPTAYAGKNTLELSIPQYGKIRDPHRFKTLFRLFLSEQENHSPSSTLELILLLLLQQVADGWTGNNEPAEPGMALAWKAQQLIGSAEKMLVADSGAIAEIARRCGFQDAGYFRRLFRRQTGFTPLEYKKRYCKEHINSDI